MNKELIDSFIKQAAGLEQTTIPIEFFGFHVRDFEKFAELVVQECVRVVDDQFWSDPHEVIQAMELIKTHFGVK